MTEEKDVSISRIARTSIGPGGITQARLAELTGVSKGLISQRERRILETRGTALSLYSLMAHCGRAGLGRRVEEALEAVPSEDRNESTALYSLMLMLNREGKQHLAEQALGVSVPKPSSDKQDSEESEMAIQTQIRLLRSIGESFEEEANKAPNHVATRLREAASKLAMVTYDAEQSLRELMRLKETDSKPEGER